MKTNQNVRILILVFYIIETLRLKYSFKRTEEFIKTFYWAIWTQRLEPHNVSRNILMLSLGRLRRLEEIFLSYYN